MKIVKILFIFALVSMIAVSCKETKKEEVQDDAEIEMTDVSSDVVEEETTDTAGEASDSDKEAATAPVGTQEEKTKEAATGIDAESKELEEFVVPEGVLAEELADTPVIYPGCSGSAEEIRACNRESFVAFIMNEFNKNLAPSLNLGGGEFEIKSYLHIDKAGKMSALKVVAPHIALEAEMVRVIGKVPAVVPATDAGEPVAISFLLPVKFKVEI